MLALTNYTFPHEAEESLMRLGHRTLRLPPHPSLPTPVASHPDMLLFFAPDAIFCTKSYYKIATKELAEISLIYGAPVCCIEEEYENAYPRDVLLNALPMKKHLFCNTKTVAKELLTLDLEPCHINQGYSKCSALPLGTDALITSDASITQKAKQTGIDVLEIQTGHILLDGYDYGFIGGCASFAPRGKINTVYFCGDISKHPDAKRIEIFCRLHGFELTSLSNSCLCDVGTIFMI